MKRATKAKPARAAKSVKARRPPTKKASARPAKKTQSVPEGLEFGELEALRHQLDLSMEQLIARLGLAPVTMHRRKTSGRLTTDESAKVVRFARLLGHAVHVFGGLEEGRQWLKRPQRELGGAVPLDRAATEEGVRDVENLLGRIRYGA